MRNTVYEEPTKAEMRGSCEIAIEQAGYEVAGTLERVVLPSELGLKGAIIGDLQGIDGNGRRVYYYIRPSVGDALPKWLANLARASHSVSSGDFYVVVRHYTAAFRQACVSAGSGLLQLTDDSTFDVIVDYEDVSPSGVETELAGQLSALRREMERKIELRRKDIEGRYQSVTRLVAEITNGDAYVERVEMEYRELEEWGLDLSRRMDEASEDPSPGAIAAIREMVTRGPVPPESGEE